MISTKKNESRDFSAAEDVWPQVLPLNLVVSDVLNRLPPLGVEQHGVSQPIADGLLADGGTIQVVGDPFREGALTAGDVDGPLKGGNVRLFHGTDSTRVFVDVNKDSCSPDYKKACNVIDMQQARQKRAHPAAPKKKRTTRRPRPVEVGPDKRTMGERLRLLMLEHEPPFNPERGGQTDLAKAAQAIYANGRESAPATIKQQHIQQLLAGQDSSRYLSVVAQVFGVSTLWLQFGIGPKRQH